jgi:hypothetical protein
MKEKHEPVAVNMKFVFAFLILCLPGTSCDETVLKVVPSSIAVEPSNTIELTCQHYPADSSEDLKLEWFRPGDTVPISELVRNQSIINITNSDILRFKSENGTLTIENATLADSGTYVCKKDDTLEVETLVNVYIMPSYTTEIIVVLIINVVLVVIFIACAGWHFVQDRRRNKEASRKRKLGH